MTAPRDPAVDSDGPTGAGPARIMAPGRGLVVALLAVFFVALLPIVIAGSRYFGDEHFYTDGALRMIQTGDYFTPYYTTDDGQPHFNKPIFTYWAAAASYRLLGVSFLSSRLPFLIAGCLLLWVTYRLSLMLFRQAQEAVVAVAVLLSNFYLYSTSVRSTPDIYQCLFLSVSLYGFMDILFNQRKTMLNYCLAYVGAGLAVETKGIPGIFPVLCAFLFCFLMPHPRMRLADLVNLKSIAAGAAIALFWFGVVYRQHGTAAWRGFYADQVSDNLSQTSVPFWGNCWGYLRGTVSILFPWSALVLLAVCLNPQMVKDFLREHKGVCLFVGLWYLAFLVIFSCSGARFVRGRYLFPTHPLLAVVIASLLTRVMRVGRSARMLPKVAALFPWAVAVYGVVLVFAGAFLAPRIVMGGILALALGVGLSMIARRGDVPQKLVTLGTALLLLFALHDTFVRPVFDVSPAPLMTQRLLHLGFKGIPVVGVGLERYTVSNIQVLSGGQIEGYNLRADAPVQELERHRILLLSKTMKERWGAPGYDIEECGYTFAPFRPADFWMMICRHDQARTLAAKKIPFYLAIKRPA